MRHRNTFSFAVLVALAFALCPLHTTSAHAASRQGDRFGLRVGAWPMPDVSGQLAIIQFSDSLRSIYSATIEEDGYVTPFLEIYGLFNVRGIWWAEISAGFAQRTNVQVDGQRLEPPLPPEAPKGDSLASKILLGEGRVDFLPLFLGVRAIKDIGSAAGPHNIYARGGISMLVASEQPSAIHPHLGRSVYSEGTKAAFGFLIGGGGEYYFGPKFGLVGDIAYRLSDLDYADDGNYDLSGFWASLGVTLRVR